MLSCNRRLWNSVTVQGRGDHDGRATKVRIQYTLDGNEWSDYQNGKVFGDVPARSGKKRFNLVPFYALTVRLVAVEWVACVCLRFGATFISQ